MNVPILESQSIEALMSQLQGKLLLVDDKISDWAKHYGAAQRALQERA